MEGTEFEQLEIGLASDRAGERLKALDRVAVKSGRQLLGRWDDDGAVALLRRALCDTDRRVRRAAARGLRPWVQERPQLLDEILPEYATSKFDGTYTHAGLYDARSGECWVPKFAALKGHAALLQDGNTDRYFKFEYYVPGQAPPRLSGTDRSSSLREAHLVLHYILDWSYLKQELVPEFDDRGRARARAEQDRYASAVVQFYRGCVLPHDVRVHHLLATSGAAPRMEYDVACIAARS